MPRKAAFALSLVILLITEVQNARAQGAASSLGLNNLVMNARLMSPISTRTSKRGGTFVVQVLAPAQYQGATIEGRINAVRRGEQHTKSRVSFTLETFTLRGVAYPIRAQLTQVVNSHGVNQTDEEGRAIVKTSKKKPADPTLQGAVVGAAVRTILGDEKGAAVATAGGSAGLVVEEITFATNGSDVEFAPGSVFGLLVSDQFR